MKVLDKGSKAEGSNKTIPSQRFATSNRLFLHSIYIIAYFVVLLMSSFA